MASSNAQRFLRGQTTDDRSLALKMFWGRVIEAFRAKTVFWDNTGNIVSSKTVDSGKSWQFPIIGDDPVPEYHTPGTELLGQAVQLDEGTITIDDILVSHYDIPIDQLQLSHFDVIAPFALKLGRSLAIDFDKKLAQTGLLAARTAAISGIHNGGNTVERTGGDLSAVYTPDATGADRILDDLAHLGQLMDEDNVPEDGRWAFMPPYFRRVLRNKDNIWSRDFQLAGMPNDLLRRTVGMLEGFMIVFTNHLPSTNIATGPTKYQGDFTFNGSTGRPAVLALCGAQEGSAGIGFVQAGGIRPFIGPDERRNTTFMKAQMMVGAGKLSVWCAGEVRVKS